MSEDEPADEAPRPEEALPGGEQQEGSAESASEEDKPAPAPKKKKRRPAAEARPAPGDDRKPEPAEPDLEADDGRPAFARRFPRDPALDALVQAFEQGNYAHVRREAPALAKRTDRPEVRKAARELKRRLDPDPLAVYMLIAAVLLLVFLAGWYWLNPHGAPL